MADVGEIKQIKKHTLEVDEWPIHRLRKITSLPERDPSKLLYPSGENPTNRN